MSMLSLRFLEHLARFTFRAIADRHPEIFDRLGTHTKCRYLIDVTDTPFVLLLLPKKRDVRVYFRKDAPKKVGAIIRSPFIRLFELAQGGSDGDALFFSREITIEGDTEAVVALRNALDDADIDIIHDTIRAMGAGGYPLRLGYKIFNKLHHKLRPAIAGLLKT
ncbi:MAG: SCP2 sterol-binding domain-containing protein, partial [Alphaproteobacteria bacterium]|nr:SCP2 sterol-binding domain-containing protein [Alphaproteobacteria bacterium]